MAEASKKKIFRGILACDTQIRHVPQSMAMAAFSFLLTWQVQQKTVREGVINDLPKAHEMW
jgi:hypothetical protein